MAKGNFIEYVEHYALPNVTIDDNGKILQVVDSVRTAVTPS